MAQDRSSTRRRKTPHEILADTGMSVAEVTREARIDRKTVERVLSGCQGCRLSSVSAVASALGVSATALVRAMDESRAREAAA